MIEYKKKIYILILNYNTYFDTIECLESVLRNSYPNYQVIVIDNNSPNNSLERIKEWAEGKLNIQTRLDGLGKYLVHPPLEKPIPYVFYTSREVKDGALGKNLEFKILERQNEAISTKYPLILIQTGNNLGFAAGNNVALKMLMHRNDCEYVWLLNPDMLIEKHTLENLVNSACNEKLIIIGCTVKDYSNPNEILCYGGAKLNPFIGTISFIKKKIDINKIDYISGNSFFTHIDNFKNLGLLPEEYFLYWEETDWCTNARSNGLNLRVCINSICYDKKSTAIGKGYLGEYYFTLNSLRYFFKYHSVNIFFVICSHILRFLKKVICLRPGEAKAILIACLDFVNIRLRRKIKTLD